MANIGKKINNTVVIEGVSWDDRYNLTGSQRDQLQNVVRLGGSDVSGTFYERALCWFEGAPGPNPTQNLYFSGALSFTAASASYANQLPNGSIVFDASGRKIWMLSSSVWLQHPDYRLSRSMG